MQTNDILLDGFTRVKEEVHRVVESLSDDELAFRPDSEANSIAWLVWHLTRVQDDHVAEVAGKDQTWVSAGWVQRFALEVDTWDTGYGHKPKDVTMVKASAEQLASYHDAVFEETGAYLRRLRDDDLDRIVDRGWDPPVTLGVRLVSVIADDLQHVGQAAYLRGLMERRGGAS
ncbi:MAG: mycothiol transferase [Acidimicrobiales bacterium]